VKPTTDPSVVSGHKNWITASFEDTAEDSILQGYYPASVGKQLTMFRRTTTPTSSGSTGQVHLLGRKMDDLQSSETEAPTNAVHFELLFSRVPL
jgi:hypothetical protein